MLLFEERLPDRLITASSPTGLSVKLRNTEQALTGIIQLHLRPIVSAMSFSPKKYIQVSGISCQGLPAIGPKALPKHTSTFYLFVTVDYQLQWTSAAQQVNNPKWEDKLYFDTTMLDNGQMSVQVYARRSVREDDMVGELSGPMDISALLDDETSKDIERSLFKKDENNEMQKTGGSIKLTLLRTNDVPGSALLGSLFGDADNAGSVISKKGKKIRIFRKLLSGTSTGVGAIQAAYDVYRPLLQNIAIIVQVVGEISEIYPYARMAWMTLSFPLKVIIAQNERDKMILDLLEAMNDIYLFVIKNNPIKTVMEHRTTVQRICQQTAECAWFISDYSSRNFGERMAKSLTTSYTSRIDGYKQTFTQLKNNLLGEVAFVTELTVNQISAKSDEILLQIEDTNNLVRIDGMHYARSAYKPDACLVGTRENVIQNILRWFSRPVYDGPRVYWLSGVAGCGKSAIACSVAEHLEAQKRCVSFFFNESNQATAGPDRLFATISRNLAGLNKIWKACLIAVLEESITSRECSTVKEQFEKFISRPAEELENIGPILIVIDALDESGTSEQRRHLLSVLKRLDELPRHFRFLITSRPEPDIVHMLDEKPWVYQYRLQESDVQLTNLDIERYFKCSLDDVPKLDKTSVDTWARQIVACSEGLFQWVATACRYIRGNGEIGHNPQERLDEVLRLSTFHGLDRIYTTILNRLSTFERDDITSRRSKTIMGRVLSLREPLSIENLSKLWFEGEDKGQVEMILEPLGSVLSGVWQKGKPVQPIHISFSDFLRDETRSGKYWIDVRKENEKLASTLLREMELLLRFNVCNLETSYKHNSEVEDLNARVAKSIPTHLNYACRYWVDHLIQAPATREWAYRINSFMRSHLLFWFEALSLMEKFGSGLDQLVKLQDWLTPLHGFNGLKQFIQDAYRFGRAFAHIIKDTTPHLYLSVLPLIPRTSPVSQTYLPKYPGCLNIIDQHKITWPQAFLNIKISSGVNAVAFSPDGKRIVGGLEDHEVRVWDANTGVIVAGPFRGHTDSVTSVGFSPNGKQVVSSSSDGTVRIWNIDTGEPAAEPFRGHTSQVRSVGFSPNGKQVVSGSSDGTVRIWNVDTGEPSAELYRGHTDAVTSVGFSPNGKQVVSGSHDMTVRIWNVDTGEPAVKPLRGHTNWVTSVCFSPNGRQVVSGSGDETVRIWNIDTGEPATEPFQGHTDWVTSVGFSPDGKQVVSSSDDETIRIWNADTGVPAAKPLRGHTSWVRSVGFSPNGKQVISGSGDKTVRIWNVNTGEHIAATDSEPLQGHNNWVRSVGFSPDGKQVVSSSYDGTVRIWNVDTGKPVAEPFQGHTSSVRSVEFSPNGRQIISCSNDGTVIIWNINTSKPAAEPFRGHANSVASVGFSPDGKQAVSGSHDMTVIIWNFNTGKPVAKPFRGHTSVVTSVGFSPDGTQVVSGSHDMTVRIWNVNTGEPVAEPFRGHTNWVTSVGFSPDGKQVISGSYDGTVRIWNIDTGKLAAEPFRGHTNWVTSVGFSPNGKQVVSGSYDGTVRIWSANTGMPIVEPFRGHADSVTSVGFSPDGKRIVSGSYDNLIAVWKYGLDTISHSNDISNPGFDFLLSPPFIQGFRRQSGWCLSCRPDKKLLFWIPEQLCPDIVLPEKLLFIAENSIRVDIRGFSHGSTWMDCYRP